MSPQRQLTEGSTLIPISISTAITIVASSARTLASGAVDHLNAATGTKHSPDAKSTLADFEAIARDGFTLEQAKAVVDAKVAEWGGDEKMAKYLRPSSLFRPNNFRRYVADAEGGSPMARASAPSALPVFASSVGKAWGDSA